MIRFATYLAPNIYETYAFIARYVGEKVGQPSTLIVGQSFNEFAEGKIDIGFMCGLPYARMAESPACPIGLLVAPVLYHTGDDRSIVISIIPDPFNMTGQAVS